MKKLENCINETYQESSHNNVLNRYYGEYINYSVVAYSFLGCELSAAKKS